MRLEIPRELKSPNRWNGRHWRYKHRESQDWEQAISASLCDQFKAEHGGIDFPNALAAFVGPRKWFGHEMFGDAKVRVRIERHAPSMRNFIRDDDNLRFAVKPLLDALKRQGYIKNDSRKWCEHDTPTQHVSADKKWLTVIEIEAVRT